MKKNEQEEEGRREKEEREGVNEKIFVAIEN